MLGGNKQAILGVYFLWKVNCLFKHCFKIAYSHSPTRCFMCAKWEFSGLLQDLGISHYHGELAPTSFKRVPVSFGPSLLPPPLFSTFLSLAVLQAHLWVSLFKLCCNCSKSQWLGSPLPSGGLDGEWAGILISFQWPGWGEQVERVLRLTAAGLLCSCLLGSSWVQLSFIFPN